MLLRLTLALLALLSGVLSQNTSDLQCRLRHEDVPEMDFSEKSCYLCYHYMYNTSFKPNMKTANTALFAGNATVSYLST
jgi:hypothetical protein